MIKMRYCDICGLRFEKKPFAFLSKEKYFLEVIKVKDKKYICCYACSRDLREKVSKRNLKKIKW